MPISSKINEVVGRSKATVGGEISLFYTEIKGGNESARHAEYNVEYFVEMLRLILSDSAVQKRTSIFNFQFSIFNSQSSMFNSQFAMLHFDLY